MNQLSQRIIFHNLEVPPEPPTDTLISFVIYFQKIQTSERKNDVPDADWFGPDAGGDNQFC